MLLLDEPTNDLDIKTLTILEDYLDHFDGIVATVSHDRYFLDRTVSRIFAFEDGRIRQYEGGYSDYLFKAKQKEEDRGEEKEAKEKPQKEKKEKPKNRKLKFSYKEEQEFRTIEGEIEALENRLSQIENEILEHARDYTKLNELTEEKTKTEETLLEKMERWEYLTDLAEKIKAERGGSD